MQSTSRIKEKHIRPKYPSRSFNISPGEKRIRVESDLVEPVSHKEAGHLTYRGNFSAMHSALTPEDATNPSSPHRERYFSSCNENNIEEIKENQLSSIDLIVKRITSTKLLEDEEEEKGKSNQEEEDEEFKTPHKEFRHAPSDLSELRQTRGFSAEDDSPEDDSDDEFFDAQDNAMACTILQNAEKSSALPEVKEVDEED